MEKKQWEKQVADIRRKFEEDKIKQEIVKAEKENQKFEAENKKRNENKKTL